MTNGPIDTTNIYITVFQQFPKEILGCLPCMVGFLEEASNWLLYCLLISYLGISFNLVGDLEKLEEDRRNWNWLIGLCCMSLLVITAFCFNDNFLFDYF